MVAPLLEARALRRSYGGRTVLDVDTLELHAGEVLAVVGPNGAGKSTLFRLLLQLERPEAGTVRIGGETAPSSGVRARLAGVFQRPILFSGSVRDNVGYGLRARGVPRIERERRTAEALRWFGLDAVAAAGVHTLSGGEVQRVALARALVLEPDILLLDEPTSNLDVTARRRFREDLDRIARQHARGILLITHDATEAVALADRIAVMHHGRIVQTGTPEDIVTRPGSPFVAALTGAELLLEGETERVEEGLCAVRLSADVLVWAATAAADGPAVGAAAIVAYRPEDIVLTTAPEQRGTSALNSIPVEVRAVTAAGGLVRVRLGAGATQFVALVTRRSAESLALVPGRQVHAQMKATALHAWRGAARHEHGRK